MFGLHKRPFVWLVIFLAGGIFIAPRNSLSFPSLVSAATGCVIASWAAARYKWLSYAALAGATFVFGIVLTISHSELPRDHIANVVRYYRRVPVEVEGVIRSDVVQRKYFRAQKNVFELEVKRLKTRWGWRTKTGRIRCQVFKNVPLSYGDYVALTGKIYRPYNFSRDELFSYPEYLKRRGIFVMMSVKKTGKVMVIDHECGNAARGKIIAAKQWFRRRFERTLTSNEAALMSAVLLGDRTAVPGHIKELFIYTGTAHILAISGLHIGIIASLVFLCTRLLPVARVYRYVITIIFLMLYAVLSGGRPSVIRATVMATVFLLSFCFERESSKLNTLALAGVIILVGNPLSLYDVGFQLSFMSVWSLFCLYPRIHQASINRFNLPENKLVQTVAYALCGAVSIWIGVAGLIAYYFRVITPITIVANVFILPLITVVVGLGFGLLAFPPLSGAFAALLKIVLNIMVFGVFLLGKIPGAFFSVKDIFMWQILCYYIIVFLSVFAVPALINSNFIYFRRRCSS